MQRELNGGCKQETESEKFSIEHHKYREDLLAGTTTLKVLSMKIDKICGVTYVIAPVDELLSGEIMDIKEE